MIYVWQGKALKQTLSVHKSGFISAMRWVKGKLYSGGKDGNLIVTNTATMQVEKNFPFGNLIRAIDV
jgi:hypothetical protein